MDNELLIALLIAGPVVVYLLIRMSSRSKIDRKVVSGQWNKARSLLNTDQPQFAVIEADKIFDSVLRQLGFRGATMGERLKNSQPSISNINQVWGAHKLRNQLVHETEAKISKKQAQEALASFEKALKGLGAL